MYPHFLYIQLANKAVAPELRAGLMDQPTFSQQAELTLAFFFLLPLILEECWKSYEGAGKRQACRSMTHLLSQSNPHDSHKLYRRD